MANKKPDTKAYLTFRAQSQEFLDFVVLVCASVPALNERLATTGVSGLSADHFKTLTVPQLTESAKDYSEQLAATIVTMAFSYFEAYVSSMIAELVEFHGGAETFIKTAERRNRSFTSMTASGIKASKSKLRESPDKAKVYRHKDNSENLVKAGVRFPSELLGTLGVRTLVKKAKKKGMKAFEIPELLFTFGLSIDEEKRIEEIRDIRNLIAHGSRDKLSFSDAMAAVRDLRAIVVKVDQYAIDHFFIMEIFA